MKKNLYLFLIVILFLVSCSITQEYHFNNDFSGTANTSIDISVMKNLLSSMDSTGEGDNSFDTLDQSLVEVAEKLKRVGAENIKYGWKNDKTVLYLTYDFKNVDVLNKTLSETGSGMDLLGKGASENGTPKFSKKGKRTLIYDAPPVKKDTLWDNSEMESMREYFQYSLQFSFNKKIKRVNNKNAEFNGDMKGFSFSGNMFDILSPDYSTDFKTKLKRK